MKILKILFLFICILIFSKLNAQSNKCLDSTIYHTSDLGNGIEQLAIPLKFKLYSDSISIRADTPDEKASFMDVSFKILSKSCQWNSDFLKVCLYMR